MQSSAANCGAYALHNGLQALGIYRSPDECEKAAGTTATNGTSTQGIIKAAKKIEGCHPILLREKRRDVALLKLRSAIQDGRPVIISWAVDQPGDHWCVVIGQVGSRYLIADSADNELVMSKSVDEVVAGWEDTSYEGVIL